MKRLALAVLGVAWASPQPSTAATITVAADGSGDFRTLNAAVAAVPDRAATPTTIHIRPGTYDGPTVVPVAKSKVAFEGEGIGRTVLTYGLNQDEPNPGVARPFWGVGVLVQGDDFTAHDLTFRNTSGDHGQAVALRITGDRAIVYRCDIIGWQDTLRVDDGRQYFHDDTIAGRVDFIYGSGAAVFDHCEVHSRNGGHVTAANTPADRPFGFVFLDCKLTGDATPWNAAATNPATTERARATPLADLGRPWRPFASVAFVRCEMGSHIRPAGWDNWRNPANERTARFTEYGSTGPGAAPDKRVPWSRQLSADEAAKLTVANVLGGADHWDPTTALQPARR
jgi:pectinesterase